VHVNVYVHEKPYITLATIYVNEKLPLFAIGYVVVYVHVVVDVDVYGFLIIMFLTESQSRGD
jgi:hypothetical protein